TSGRSGGCCSIQCSTSFAQTLKRCQLMLWCKVGIANRHLNSLMPHRFLHRSKIDSSHDQSTGEGMPKAMPSEVFQTCISDRRLEPLSRACRALTKSIEKYVV